MLVRQLSRPIGTVNGSLQPVKVSLRGAGALERSMVALERPVSHLGKSARELAAPATRYPRHLTGIHGM